MVSAEALLRWDSPDPEWSMPDSFIPVAEATGLIEPIGAWVLQQGTCGDRLESLAASGASNQPVPAAGRVFGDEFVRVYASFTRGDVS